MSDYLSWCEKIKRLPPDMSGHSLESANTIRYIVLDDGQQVVRKEISSDRPYVPRIKALGEVAYALLDHHLAPSSRVTPNVYATSPNTIWRTFLPGTMGEDWRARLYDWKGNLERADLEMIDQIMAHPSSERIALLDMIFLCQDRSGRNWLEHNGRFWAIDNNMFWSYKGRFADKVTIRTGEVDHLQPPMNALVSRLGEFQFGNGVFSSLRVGRTISTNLLDRLSQFDWQQYLRELKLLVCTPLFYPLEIVDDWRFRLLQDRANWLLDKRRFPTVAEALKGEWQDFICRPEGRPTIWEREWEIRHLETA